MATRSRLGKGLGALFPDLPQLAETHADTNTNAQASTQAVAYGHSRSATPNKDNASAQNPNIVSRETIGDNHKADSGEVRTTTKDHPSGVKRSRNKSTNHKRSSVPHLNELSHPSDLFFGDGSSNTINAAQTSHGDSRTLKHGNNTDVSRETSAGKNAQPLFQPSEETVADNDDTAQHDGSSESEALSPINGAYLAMLSVQDITPNQHQPRSIFDEDELVELSHSITEVGVLQPIVVRKRQRDESSEASTQAPYELIMGERRWRASKLAKIAKIPAIVKTTPDNDMLRDALLENLHRVALNPLEEAAAYQQMIEEFGLTQEQLSHAISKSRPQIANMLRLLQLPASVQKKVASGVLSAGHARALLALSHSDEMESLANRIIAEGLSVRTTEEIVSLSIHRPEAKKRSTSGRSNVWADSEVRNHLENHFETKVSIVGSKNKGKIEIVFSSSDDMQRIVEMLLPAKDDGAHKQNDGWV